MVNVKMQFATEAGLQGNGIPAVRQCWLWSLRTCRKDEDRYGDVQLDWKNVPEKPQPRK